MIILNDTHRYWYGQKNQRPLSTEFIRNKAEYNGAEKDTNGPN